ncbi:hypothetical protein PHYPSEUDO_013286 [Phytophthora pseudosyringae]|uniref:Uncharacterized protein n=1 Tax=Phytophthora pseudosyringae TaxID=221518 RepID=A0A8T1VAD1_9STRA|nr:hypothetical protein PHYPSEUDO_013286 [Phytophthora pseudosyringae]
MTYATKCHDANCDICPCYGWVRGRPVSCVSHKLDGMINVTHMECSHHECQRSAIYGYTKRQFCSTHKAIDMVLVCRSMSRKTRSSAKKPTMKSKQEIMCDIQRRSAKAAAIAKRIKDQKALEIKNETLQNTKFPVDPLNQIIFTMLAEDAKLLLQLRAN